MKKVLLLLVTMLVCIAAEAQWTKPVPKGQPMSEGTEMYLFNVDASGFLCGANDWGTRASVEPLHGHKIWLKRFEYEDLAWDGESYFIWNNIEAGGMQGQNGVMFMNDAWNFWVDRTAESDDARNYGAFVFVAQGDNVYKFAPKTVREEFPENYVGMMPRKDDNRLYLNIDQIDARYAPDVWYTRWIFVSPADYEAYKSDVERYELAVRLGAAIEKAKKEAPSVNLDEVESVYNNTGSTQEQLRTAFDQLASLVGSPTSMVDYAGVLLKNPSYDNNNNDGWSGTAPGFQSFGNAERWNTSVNHYQDIVGLPNGVYQVQVTGYYRSGTNEGDAQNYEKLQSAIGEQDFQLLKLYANSSVRTTERALPLQNSGASDDVLEGSTSTVQTTFGHVPNNMETAAVYVAAGQYKPTSVVAVVNDGKLTMGLKKDAVIGDDWSIWDDWKLLFVGNSDVAYQWMRDEILTCNADLMRLIEDNPTILYQYSIYENFKASKAALEAATDAPTVVDAAKAYEENYQAMIASINAYSAFLSQYNEVKNWLDGQMGESEQIDVLADYLSGDTPEGYNGNGSADYILNNGTLNIEQLKAEQAYMERLWNDAMANSMADGDDCTAMLKNPNFSEAGGCTTAVGPTFPTEGHYLLNGQNMIFDVYQELTGLQNGLYELDYNGYYRPGDLGSFSQEEVDKSKCYAYINDYSTKVPSIIDDLAHEALNIDDYNYRDEGYCPVNTAGTDVYFQKGMYAARAYGLVTEGTMKVGFRNELRVADGSTAYIGPVRLIFRAKNAEALKEVIENTASVAIDLLNGGYVYGQPEQNALDQAQEHATTCSDEELYDALISLSKCIDDANEGIDAYRKLLDAMFNLEQAIANNEKASQAVIDEATTLFNEAENAYNTQSFSTEEAEDMVTQLNAMVVNIMFPGDEASEENPVDYTSAIVNNNFDPARGDKSAGTIEGWTTTAMNGYKEYTVSYNRAPFELSQKLTGLPKGKYKVTVHTYYRAGYWDEEETRVKNGEETHLTTLYAKTSADEFTIPVMNLYEDASDQPMEGVNCYTLGNGKYAPDGTSATAAYFKAGYYLNELTFIVPEDGEVTIGLSKTEVFANDYEVVGEWKLWYMGEDKPSEEHPANYSSLIVNNTFDPARGDKSAGTIEGWTTTAMNGYKEYTVSYNRAPFELYQKLTGLPKGKYKVTVHTYYRAGYWDEEETRVKNGEETHLTTLYAKTSADEFTIPVMNLYEDASDQPMEGVNCYTLGNGKYAPDGTSATAAYFKAGYYLNELTFIVPEDGEVTIGLSKTEVFANDYEVVGEWNLWYMGEVKSELEETDMSSLIVNNTFDPARGDKSAGTIEGWTTTAMNGYKEYSVSYNRAGFELYQDLAGLKEGTYKVTVHTYYRAGYWDEEETRVKNGEETHLTTLYAQTTDQKYAKPVMNLYEDASDQPMEGVNCYTLGNGKYAPDGTSATVAYFKAGYYLNELPFYVGSDGKVRIGLSKTEVFANDYEVVGEWNLYYYGSGNNLDLLTGIEGVDIEEAAQPVAMPVGIYSLNGTRLSAPQRGINIIRMADGSVRKIMVK